MTPEGSGRALDGDPVTHFQGAAQLDPGNADLAEEVGYLSDQFLLFGHGYLPTVNDSIIRGLGVIRLSIKDTNHYQKRNWTLIL